MCVCVSVCVYGCMCIGVCVWSRVTLTWELAVVCLSCNWLSLWHQFLCALPLPAIVRGLGFSGLGLWSTKGNRSRGCLIIVDNGTTALRPFIGWLCWYWFAPFVTPFWCGAFLSKLILLQPRELLEIDAVCPVELWRQIEGWVSQGLSHHAYMWT